MGTVPIFSFFSPFFPFSLPFSTHFLFSAQASIHHRLHSSSLLPYYHYAYKSSDELKQSGPAKHCDFELGGLNNPPLI